MLPVTTFPLRFRHAFAISLIFLCGCGAEEQSFQMVFDPCQPIELVTEESATAMEVAALERAVALWQGAISTPLSVASMATSQSDLGDGTKTLPVLRKETNWYLGRFDDTRGVIWLANRIPTAEIRAVVLAHELGHAFGLYHVEDRRSVMNTGNKTIAPTEQDAQALETLWGECVVR